MIIKNKNIRIDCPKKRTNTGSLPTVILKIKGAILFKILVKNQALIINITNEKNCQLFILIKLTTLAKIHIKLLIPTFFLYWSHVHVLGFQFSS